MAGSVVSIFAHVCPNIRARRARGAPRPPNAGAASAFAVRVMLESNCCRSLVFDAACCSCGLGQHGTRPGQEGEAGEGQIAAVGGPNRSAGRHGDDLREARSTVMEAPAGHRIPDRRMTKARPEALGKPRVVRDDSVAPMPWTSPLHIHVLGVTRQECVPRATQVVLQGRITSACHLEMVRHIRIAADVQHQIRTRLRRSRGRG